MTISSTKVGLGIAFMVVSLFILLNISYFRNDQKNLETNTEVTDFGKKLNEISNELTEIKKVINHEEKLDELVSKINYIEKKLSEGEQTEEEKETKEEKDEEGYLLEETLEEREKKFEREMKIEQKYKELICNETDTSKIRNIIFFKTPKTSSSTISGILRVFADRNNLTIIFPLEPTLEDCGTSYQFTTTCIKEFVKVGKQYNISLTHLQYTPELDSIVPDPYFIFSIRHPYTRAISMYKHGQLMKSIGKEGFWNEYDDVGDWVNAMDRDSMYKYLRNKDPNEIDFFFSQTSFESSILLLKRKLGFGIEETLYFTSKNLTSSKISEFSNQLIYDKIMSKSKLDLDLYLKGEEFLIEEGKKIENFEEEKLAYLRILEEARTHCQKYRTKEYAFAIATNGHHKLESDNECISNDEGCGYKCFGSWASLKKSEIC